MSTEKPFYLLALEGLRRKERLFQIFIFTLVTAFFWIGFSIFLSQRETKVSIDIQKHTTPLNPNINRTVLEELAARKLYSPEELNNFPLYERLVDDKGNSQLIVAGTKPIDSSDTTTVPVFIDDPNASGEAVESDEIDPLTTETPEDTDLLEVDAAPTATPIPTVEQ